MAGGHRGSTWRGQTSGPRRATRLEFGPVDRGRRPADFLYVITQGTFLIEQLGNYLIADIQYGRAGAVCQVERAAQRFAAVDASATAAQSRTERDKRPS
jgi:hypothetical protein